MNYGTHMTRQGPPPISIEGCMTRVGDSTPPAGFLQFWSGWHERAWANRPQLDPIEPVDASRAGAPGVTHVVRSVGDVRVGCRVSVPDGRLRGAVIDLHGYGMDPAEPLRGDPGLTRRGLCHVALRVRGYPGSQFDAGDLISRSGGYITLGLNDPQSWIAGQAVSDVVSTYRAIRAQHGPEFPISIRGESFGGALAIVAASAIVSRDTVHRLAIGVPTLGDWMWRLSHPEKCGGAGEELLRAMPTDAGHIAETLRTLRFFDVVIHARRIICPVVCKMASSDPVVAPATVAAVYNALGTAPGWKWRFMTDFAHIDPGSSVQATDDLRRHALFARLTEEFLDPGVYPQTLMKQWEPELGGIRPRAAG